MLRDYVHSSELTKHEQGIYLGIRKKDRQTDKKGKCSVLETTELLLVVLVLILY